jgi:hypothetical protein
VYFPTGQGFLVMQVVPKGETVEARLEWYEILPRLADSGTSRSIAVNRNRYAWPLTRPSGTGINTKRGERP